MRDAVCNNLNSKPLCIADRFVTALAVTHDTGKLKYVRDPAAVFFSFHLNG